MRFADAARDAMGKAGAMLGMTRKVETFAQARQRMIEDQLIRRGITDQRVLRAMAEVPRESFVPVDAAAYAYDDAPLPIGSGQTISQPFMVATMLEAAAINPGDKVLEVGTGSGYVAALLSRMAGAVYTIERDATLYAIAKQRLDDDNRVQTRHGDGAEGWPDAAPFDAILVSAAPKSVPAALKAQLAVGGRLLVPIGDRFMQRLTRLTRRSNEVFSEENLGAVMFVPLL